MIRLDDNELNIHPAVAAALGRFRPEFVDGQVGSRIRLEPSDVAENPFVGFTEGAEVFGGILLCSMCCSRPLRSKESSGRLERLVPQRLHTRNHTGRHVRLVRNIGDIELERTCASRRSGERPDPRPHICPPHMTMRAYPKNISCQYGCRIGCRPVLGQKASVHIFPAAPVCCLNGRMSTAGVA